MDEDARGIPRPDALPARTQRAVPRASALWRQARPTPENVDQAGRDSRNVGGGSTMMDLSWTSALAPWLLTRETALLLVGGFVVGIFSVIIGGGFFISIPLLQFLFPSVSYG